MRSCRNIGIRPSKGIHHSSSQQVSTNLNPPNKSLQVSSKLQQMQNTPRSSFQISHQSPQWKLTQLSSIPLLTILLTSSSLLTSKFTIGYRHYIKLTLFQLRRVIVILPFAGSGESDRPEAIHAVQSSNRTVVWASREVRTCRCLFRLARPFQVESLEVA